MNVNTRISIPLRHQGVEKLGHLKPLENSVPHVELEDLGAGVRVELR